MQITEIFYSIDGEGTRVGLPVVFIRSFGCNMLCSYCDSHYSVLPSCRRTDVKEMTISEIVDNVRKYPCKRVTFTGGEPLLQKDCYELIRALISFGYEVNVETNGSVNPYKLNPYCSDTLEEEYLNSNRLFFTFDYKCPTSNQEDKMDLSILRDMKNKDVLKFVVGSREDLEKAEYITAQYSPRGQVYLSPVFGKINSSDIVEFLKKSDTFLAVNARMQLQLHKFIWDVNQIGV